MAETASREPDRTPPETRGATGHADLKRALGDLARSLGFDGCGVAAVGRPPHFPALARWLEDGFAGSMAWMGRHLELRGDPARLLPGARSAVVLAMPYWQGENPRALAGRVARYAWGRDYHRALAGKLRRVAALLAGAGGHQRPFVDSAPVMERDFAALAGVGWQGKSTMLLNRRQGTWFLLCGVLTTLELEPDPPARDHCGRCTRCIDACPTRAIVAPYRLDARRCLSYLTIENRGAIPEAFRAALGERIFGCDDCLEACPWNRFAAASRDADFAMRPVLRETPLRAFLAMDEAGFRRAFEGSPIRRAGHAGFRRNVCVALGNCGGPDDRAALAEIARGADPLLAEHAGWALDRIAARS